MDYNVFMSKGRILKLLRLLEDQTDNEHPLSADAIISRLEEMGETVERKTVYSDVRILNECGYPVESVNGRINGFYYDGNVLDGAETRIITDAIMAAEFIDDKKSDDLVNRIMGLTNVYERRIIQANPRYRHPKTASAI